MTVHSQFSQIPQHTDLIDYLGTTEAHSSSKHQIWSFKIFYPRHKNSEQKQGDSIWVERNVRQFWRMIPSMRIDRMHAARATFHKTPGALPLSLARADRQGNERRGWKILRFCEKHNNATSTRCIVN
jgi:hypothetical protein